MPPGAGNPVPVSLSPAPPTLPSPGHRVSRPSCSLALGSSGHQRWGCSHPAPENKVGIPWNSVLYPGAAWPAKTLGEKGWATPWEAEN